MSSRLRSIAERLSRGVVFNRRLPHSFGGRSICVSPESALRVWVHRLEKVDPELFAQVGRLVRPGDVVWDIGANIGMFAFAAAHVAGPAGRVVAVEADGWLADLLHKSESRRLPSDAPTTILCAAVADRLGLAAFHVAQRCRSASFLEEVGGSTQSGGSRQPRTVVTITLDWMLDHLPAPKVLKIDVESAEALVLRGAAAVLAHRPRIWCEVASENEAFVANFLRSHGYRLFDGGHRPAETAGWNTVALPIEEAEAAESSAA